MPTIFAADLDRLTLATIDTWKGRIIIVKDRQNVTEARLQILRILTAQALEATLTPTFEAGQLSRDSPRNISPVLSERSPSCNDANVIASRLEKDDLKAAEDAYNTLLHMGGRPTCPTQYRNGLKSDGCQTDHLLQYPNEGARLRAELEKWRAFRDHQKAVRKDLSTFRKAQIYVNSYWQKRGLRQEFKPQLLLNLQLQTKLEEWKEFYFHQHQRLVQKEKEMKETEWQAQISLKKMITTTSRYRDSLEGADGWYRAAQVDLEAYNGWLAWIEGRIPKISSEHADKAQDVVKATKSQVKASRL